MLFITVGTTDFDPLVAAGDALAAQTGERVVIQIGHGEVEPQHAEWLRFALSLEPYYDQAEVVITHGGLGTLTELLHRGQRVVGVSNPDRFDRHQDQILQAFSQANHLIWCQDLKELALAVEQARSAHFTPYTPPRSHIHELIAEFLAR
ncbi:MAG: PssE/Cps14G family polysaccharide biosynthesis glycosyltransferase [Caldilineales bacterium]